jgi:cellulose synthase/poly-beta-1,6-N-acetylglucosamine synthase-like glycosyltransferase
MTGSDTLARSPSEYALSPFHERIQSRKIALLIPCLNEEQTIAKVIRDFRKELPEAVVYVYDNNSSDRTALMAEAAGARVVREKRQGKGFVVASMFEDVEADLYVLVDGDGKDRTLPLCNPGFRDNGYLRHLRRHRDHSRCDQSSSARVDSHPRCSKTAA